MKLKSALTSALLALGLLSRASAADNVVYLTGSTAFRSTVYTALITDGRVFDTGTVTLTAARGGSSTSGANYHLFHGNINGTPTYINCAWSGSEAGIASAANATLDNDGTPLPGSPETWLLADGTVTGDGRTNPPTYELEASSHGGDLAMADTSQQVSWTPRVPNTATDLKDYGTVGIVTFAWVKNRQTTPSAEWSAFKNITLPQAQALISQGYQPTAFFTGVASQTNNNVYLIGRNKGSGTRANALADHSYGTTRTVTQFSIGAGVTNSQTDTLLLEYVGNNGYESGGGVARALRVDGSCQQTDPFFSEKSGWYAVGYLGTSDALSTGNGYTLTTNNWLLLDGVFANDGTIEEGSYYFWGHEHLYGKHNISGFQDTAGTKIFSGIVTTLGTAGSDPTAHSPGIALQYMHCDKASDVAYPARN